MEIVIGLLVFALFLVIKNWENSSKSERQARFRESDPRPERDVTSSSDDTYYAQRAKFILRMRQYTGVPDVPSYNDAYIFKAIDVVVESSIRKSGDNALRAKLHSLMSEYMVVLPEYLSDRQSLEWKNTSEHLVSLDTLIARRVAIEDQIASFLDERLTEVLLLARSNQGGFFLNFEPNGDVSETGRVNFPKLVL